MPERVRNGELEARFGTGAMLRNRSAQGPLSAERNSAYVLIHIRNIYKRVGKITTLNRRCSAPGGGDGAAFGIQEPDDSIGHRDDQSSFDILLSPRWRLARVLLMLKRRALQL